jgi:type I restriction enzyme R subunit
VRLEENPAFYQSLRERLEQIIEDLRANRITTAEQLKLFGVIKDEVVNEAKVADDLGLSPSGFAIYGVLERAAPSIRHPDLGDFLMT